MGKLLSGIAGLLLAALPAVGEVREHLVLVQSEAGVVSVVDPSSGEVEASVRVGIRPQSVAVSPDGRLAVVTNEGAGQGGSSLAVVDLIQLRLARSVRLQYQSPLIGEDAGLLTFHRPTSLCFLNDSKHVLVTCPADDVLLVVDVLKGEVAGVVRTGGQGPGFVLASPNGRSAYVSNAGSGSVSIIDVGRRRVIDTFQTGSGAAGMVLHPERDEIWVANAGSNSISVIDLVTFEERAEFAAGSAPARLAFTDDGRFLLCTNQEGSSISVFHGESFKVVREITLSPPGDLPEVAEPRLGEDLAKASGLKRGCRPLDLLFDPGRTRLYVTCTRSSAVAEIDTADWRVLRYLEVGPGPRGLAWWRSEDDWVSAK